jgi:stage III sporulation protein AE
MKALSAVFAAVYTGIGELGSGASHGVWVFSLTAVTEELCGKLLLPIMQISFASTLTSTAVSGVNVSRFVQMLRNAFTSLLIFFMTVISVILSFQTVVAHTSDSLAMRGVRYAVSHSVPIIGGLVSDSARTLATSFTLMKNSIGLVAVVIIIVISLYPLITLTASKYALQLASSFSSLILEDRDNIFLDEAVKMLNFLIAIVIMIGITFIFCVSLFALLPTGN